MMINTFIQRVFLIIFYLYFDIDDGKLINTDTNLVKYFRSWTIPYCKQNIIKKMKNLRATLFNIINSYFRVLIEL